MTDANTGETPAELVPPILPVPPPEAAALDAAPPLDVERDAAPADARALPFDVEDVEHLGVLRRSVLDHLLDCEGDQTVAQILAGMPAGTTRNSLESAVRRERESGRVERVAP
jgi:hypothetical protein